jgi:hypothetical protein
MFHLRERFDHRDLELIQYYGTVPKGISPKGKLFPIFNDEPEPDIIVTNI